MAKHGQGMDPNQRLRDSEARAIPCPSFLPYSGLEVMGGPHRTM